MNKFDKTYKLIMQGYDWDIYGGVYDPMPEEDFDVKVSKIFDVMERQIKKKPELLQTLQSKIEYSINAGTPTERAILLHVLGLLHVQPISFEQKDIIKDLRNYLGEDPDLYLNYVKGDILRMAKNIGVKI